MKESNELGTTIPVHYRKMENTHIIFWLLKDISWCMVWKVLGLAMIAPTLIISIIIVWRSRELKSELAHNLAITFWIAANSYWMISEFFNFDEMHIWRSFEGRHLAIIPFAIGALVLAFYYVVQKPRASRQEAAMATL